MGSLVKALVGGGEKPRASQEPASALKEDKRKSKKARASLFETEGGASGQELDPSAVTQRSTLLGN